MPRGGVTGRLKMLTYCPCMLRFLACPAIAFQATVDLPAFAENLHLINRSEVPPSGGALEPGNFEAACLYSDFQEYVPIRRG
jgi:hypothetical protein